MPACLKCQSERVVLGAIVGGDGVRGSVFRPRPLRLFTFTFLGGTELSKEAFACLDCGLVWSSTPPAGLQKSVKRHCPEPVASMVNGVETR